MEQISMEMEQETEIANSEAADPFNSLPPETLCFIFKFLDQANRLNCRVVKSLWADLVLGITTFKGVVTDNDDSFAILSNFTSKGAKFQRVSYEDLSENNLTGYAWDERGNTSLKILLTIRANEINIGRNVSALNLYAILVDQTRNITAFTIGEFALADLDTTTTPFERFINNFGEVTNFTFCVRPSAKMYKFQKYGTGENMRFENHVANMTKFLQLVNMARLTTLTMSVVLPYPNDENYQDLHGPFFDAVRRFVTDYGPRVESLSVNIDGIFAKPLLRILPIMRGVPRLQFTCALLANRDISSAAFDQDQEEIITSLSSFRSVQEVDLKCDGMTFNNCTRILHNYPSVVELKLNVTQSSVQPEVDLPPQAANLGLRVASFSLPIRSWQSVNVMSWLSWSAPCINVLKLHSPTALTIISPLLDRTIEEFLYRVTAMEELVLSSPTLIINNRVFDLPGRIRNPRPVTVTHHNDGVYSSVTIKVLDIPDPRIDPELLVR